MTMLPLNRRLTDEELREFLIAGLLADKEVYNGINVEDNGLESLYQYNLPIAQRRSGSRDNWQQFYNHNHNDFAMRAGEIINEWQNQNIVMPDPKSRGPHGYTLTSYGRIVLAAEEAIERDPEGVIQRLRAEVPGLDSLTMESFTEAMSCFRNREHKPSAVMLGVAAENAIKLLAEAIDTYIPSIPGAKPDLDLQSEKVLTVKTAVVKFIRGNRLSRQLPQLLASKGYSCSQDELDLFKDVEETFDTLFAHYRRSRNESGHPVPVQADREMLRSHLLNFRRYARVAFGIKALLEKL